MSILQWFVLAAVAVLAGVWVGNQFSDEVHFLGSLFRFLGGLAYAFISALAILAGGVYIYVAFILTVLFVAIAKVNWEHMRSSSIRRRLLG
jgi:hypothetical protein